MVKEKQKKTFKQRLTTWQGILTLVIVMATSLGTIFSWPAKLVRGYDEYQAIRTTNKMVPMLIKRSKQRDSLATVDRNLLWANVDTLKGNHKGTKALCIRYDDELDKLTARVKCGKKVLTMVLYINRFTGRLSFDHKGVIYPATTIEVPE